MAFPSLLAPEKAEGGVQGRRALCAYFGRDKRSLSSRLSSHPSSTWIKVAGTGVDPAQRPDMITQGSASGISHVHSMSPKTVQMAMQHPVVETTSLTPARLQATGWIHQLRITSSHTRMHYSSAVYLTGWL